MNYLIEGNELACTIFVPFNCGNNCPFCNTKKLYENFIYKEEYLNNILNKIDLCNKIDYIKGYIITGGEPFFNLDILKIIIDKMEKPCTINTTLPKINNIDSCINFINTCKKIEGISLSRQLKYIYNINIIDNIYLYKIHKPIKINTILTEDLLNDKIISEFIKKYENVSYRINFRADYTKITSETLKNIDNIDKYLFTKYKYIGSRGCLICYAQTFEYKPNCMITYHRGLEFSSLTFGNNCYIKDIIIDMYGNIYKDWDFKEDLEFNKWIESI